MGLVDPYRNPHPHLSEVKKVYQPAKFSYPGNGVAELENKNFFADFTDKSIAWKLLENGMPILERKITVVEVAPQTKWKFKLVDFPRKLNKRQGVYFRTKPVAGGG